MKKYLMLLLFLTGFLSYAQISVSSKHIGPSSKFKKGQLEKFKASKTIFVFSNVFEKSTYEEILKNSWSVTPYEIVSVNDFNIKNYLKDNHSFATLEGLKVTKTKSTGMVSVNLYTYFDISIYESDKLLKKLTNYSGGKSKKIKKIISNYRLNIARFELFPKDDFIHIALSQENEKITDMVFKDDAFFNYQPGFLQNYFQKISQLLIDEEIFWKYKDLQTSELEKLATDTLYIPDYIKTKFNPFFVADKDRIDVDIDKLFSNYDYQHKFISKNDLNQKILNNEEFYYLRYVRVNSEKFIQVVNSKTGNVIYRDYKSGFSFSYNLTEKNLKALNKAIEKEVKKVEKMAKKS
jgi:hypothetical protein